MEEESHFLFDERFGEAFLHTPHVVLGKRLPPFSFWHKVQLEWVNSKILLGGADKWDLWLAVRICTSQYPKQGKLPPKKLPSWWKLLWNIRHICTNWEKEQVKFRRYMADYFSPPKTWGGSSTAKQRLAEAHDALFAITQDPVDAKEAAIAHKAAATEELSDREIDDSLEQVAAYCKRGGRPPSEAWNMGAGELMWMNAVFFKMDGGKTEIWTPGDQMRFEKHLLRRAENIKNLTIEILEKYPDLTQQRAEAEANVMYWAKCVGNVDEGGKGYGK